jgi:aryl-alcohol dehydrogenase-like predicted oxidoreductase
MQRRMLGNSGFEVAPLAFGGNVFGWTVDEATSFRLLDHFVAQGFNLIDTANSYSRWVQGNEGGESETILGKWIRRRGRHDDVVIATKVGSDIGLGYRTLAREHILKEAENSLRRLQVECIDLYQSHWDDEKTPFEETLEAYAKLMRDGKVKAIGASNLDAERLLKALSVSREQDLPRYQTLQPLYNLYDRFEFEGRLQSVCEREHMGVITYYSLASGFLSGKYRSEADAGKSARGAGIVRKYLDARGRGILAALDDVAAARGVTRAQVALAWLLHRPAVTAPIVSATSIAQLDEIIGATRVTLDDADMARLDAASAKDAGKPA